jgi:hypothetical protein
MLGVSYVNEQLFELLGFVALSIARYSEHLKTQHAGICTFPS